MILWHYLFIIISILILGAIIVIFYQLVKLKNDAKMAWSNVDTLLKQRHDVLSELLATCKPYMQYESDTVEGMAKARALAIQARESRDMALLNQTESILQSTLKDLFALADKYPELKTNQSFLQLQYRIRGLENAIVERQELYNDCVTLNNSRIERFPDVMVAKLFGFGYWVPLAFVGDKPRYPQEF